MTFAALVQDSLPVLVAPIARAVEPWQLFYADHRAVSTAVLFVHIASLIGSAGVAVANDRLILRTPSEDLDGRATTLLQLVRAHRTVLTALSLSVASGLLLLLADLEAFVVMPAFWAKLSLLLLLVINAALMLRTERQVKTAPATAVAAVPAARTLTRLWQRLRAHAATSLVLWFAIVFAGTAMSN